jgi:hypothetical protein
MLLGYWHRAAVEPALEGIDDPRFVAHLHGRDLVVVHVASPPHWHWRVTSPHGVVLAEGDAPTRDAAEQAAENEATAVHPPSDELLDRLLS